MGATPVPKPLLGRIPRIRQWYVIWFLWGLLLGWVVWGGGFHSGTSVSIGTDQAAENAFSGFANSALRRNWGACGMLSPTAGREFLQAIGAISRKASPSGYQIDELCALRLGHVPLGRITAFIQPGPAGNLDNGFSQGNDQTRAKITFGQSPEYVATLVDSPQYGWHITSFAPKRS